MRVSSSMLYQQTLTSIGSQQSQIIQLQSQMSSGLRVQVAADDPVAAGQILMVGKVIADNTQWQANATALQNRLGLEDSTLSSVSSALQQIQTLALQANNSTLNASDRASIAQAMQAQLDSLVAAANTQDGNGRYLFAGSQDGSAPFQVGAGGVSYSGNSNVASLPVGSTRQIASSDAGDAVFMNLQSGDGTVAGSAAAANTGTAAIQNLQVTDPTQWDGGSYTLSFSGGSYQVQDSGGNTVASGTYADGTAISFRGASITLSGTPASGDSFSIGPAQSQSLFSTVQNLINQVAAAPASPAAQAQNQTAIYGSLKALAGAQSHISTVQAGVGAREKAAADTTTQLQATATQLNSALSGLQDLDYATATTQLSQAQVTLQAAEQTFAQVQGLSLFNYLK